MFRHKTISSRLFKKYGILSAAAIAAAMQVQAASAADFTWVASAAAAWQAAGSWDFNSGFPSTASDAAYFSSNATLNGSAPPTFNGNVFIESGTTTFNITNGNNTLGTGTVTLGQTGVASAAVLDFGNLASNNEIVRNNFIVDGTGAKEIISRGAVSRDFTGTIEIKANNTLTLTTANASYKTIFSNMISGAGNIVTSGMARFTADNSGFTGKITNMGSSQTIEFTTKGLGNACVEGTGIILLSLDDAPYIASLSVTSGGNGQIRISDSATLTIGDNNNSTFFGRVCGLDSTGSAPNPPGWTFASTEGSVVKVGSGTLTLSHNSPQLYTGSTTIKEGAITVGGSAGTGSIANSTKIIVGDLDNTTGKATSLNIVNGSNNGMMTLAHILGGHGSVNGNLTASTGSTLAPGAATPGTLTFNNTLTLQSGVELDYNFASASAYDSITAGTLTFTAGEGTATLNLFGGAAAFAPGATNNFTLFTYTTLTAGRFEETILGDTTGSIVLGNGWTGINFASYSITDEGGRIVFSYTVNTDGPPTGPFIGNSNTPTQFPEPWTTTARSADPITSEIKTADASSLTFDGGADILGTKATITLSVEAADTDGPDITMAWRTRTQNEIYDEGTQPPFLAPAMGLFSDAVKIGGIADDGSELYALEMTFHRLDLVGPESDHLQPYISELLWLDDGLRGADYYWVPAGGNGEQLYMSFADWAALGLDWEAGIWGIDFVTDTAWVILDHGGIFAVVPEPTSLAMLGLGAVGLLARRRRR